MAISKVENPATGEEITVIKGVVERVMFKEAVNDRFGNTHRASVLIDGDWVGNISIKTKEGYDPQIRFNNGNNAKPDWQTLEVGDEVRLVVTENEYNGKIYYNSGTSKIKLVKKGEGKPSQPQQRTPQGSQNASGGFKKDMTGVQVGHAINAAMNLIQGESNISLDYIAKVAKQLHDVSERVKEAYKDANPNMSEYDVGAAAGQSVLTACKLVDNVEDVEEMALMLLDQVVPEVTAYVKGEAKEGTTKQQPKPAQKPKPQPKPVEQQEPSPDFDDQDLPF
jgi:hypothetical protein